MTKKTLTIKIRITDYEGSFSEYTITVDLEHETVKEIEEAEHYGYRGPFLTVDRWIVIK